MSYRRELNASFQQRPPGSENLSSFALLQTHELRYALNHL